MRNIILISRRELGAYLRTMSGYIIIAAMLFLAGLCFNVFALPGAAKKSSEILADYFWWTSGITMAAAVFLSMRLIAEERQLGTIVVLQSSPVHDLEIVLGKFISSLLFLMIFLACTLVMPLIVAMYGKVSIGHIAAGYFGLILVGAMSLAIGVFASALTRSQLVAAIISAMLCIALSIFWVIGKVTDRPLTDVVSGMAWMSHFDAFRNGLVHLKHVGYFALVSFVALFAATRVLEARRWR